MTEKKVRFTIVHGENAFLILGQFKHAAQRQGFDPQWISAVIKEACSGNYQQLIGALSRYSDSPEIMWRCPQCRTGFSRDVSQNRQPAVCFRCYWNDQRTDNRPTIDDMIDRREDDEMRSPESSADFCDLDYDLNRRY